MTGGPILRKVLENRRECIMKKKIGCDKGLARMKTAMKNNTNLCIENLNLPIAFLFRVYAGPVENDELDQLWSMGSRAVNHRFYRIAP